MNVCGCAGQLSGVNIWNCMNVKQGITKKEHARSAKNPAWINKRGSEAVVIAPDCVV